MAVKMRRIRRINKPPDAQSFERLEPQVHNFIKQDTNQEFNFVIEFVGDFNDNGGLAMVTVYTQQTDPLEIPVKIGVYTAGEWKRFKADISRVTADNPEGAIELAPNLLFNGMFNHIPDPLEGWEIDTDTTGGLQITGVLDRLRITAPGMGGFKLINTKTTLENLKEYEVITNVHNIVSNSDINMLIGSTIGATRTERGVYNEDLIAGGPDVIINGNINTPDDVIELEYIIVNG